MTTNATPTGTQIGIMVHEILVRQMKEDPQGTTISSGIILPTIADHGFSDDHELLVEGPAEEIWGQYLKGGIIDPVAHAADAIRDA